MAEVDLVAVEEQVKQRGFRMYIQQCLDEAHGYLNQAAGQEGGEFVTSCTSAIASIMAARKVRNHVRVQLQGLEKDDAAVAEEAPIKEEVEPEVEPEVTPEA